MGTGKVVKIQKIRIRGEARAEVGLNSNYSGQRKKVVVPPKDDIRGFSRESETTAVEGFVNYAHETAVSNRSRSMKHTDSKSSLPGTVVSPTQK